MPLRFHFANGFVKSKRMGAQATAVIDGADARVTSRLSRILLRSTYFRGMPFHQVNFTLMVSFEPKAMAYRHRVKLDRRAKMLDFELNVHGPTAATLSMKQYENDLLWTCLDMLIHAGAKYGCRTDGIVQARAKLFAPHPGRDAFAGAMGSNRPPPEPEDPFKHELEIVAPLTKKNGTPDEGRAMKQLVEAIEMEFDSYCDGMLEAYEMGMGEANFFLHGTSEKGLLRAARAAIRGSTWEKRATGWLRRPFTTAKGRRVML